MCDKLNALFTGKVCLRHHSLDSTNAEALRLISEGSPPEGLVIISEYQTQGKGMAGNRWHSQAGENLTLSIIYYPHQLKPAAAFQLNRAIALGIIDMVEHIEPALQGIRIKWPNDIYYHGKKLAGILIQNVIQGNNIEATVAGIGLNVNQTRFPEELPNPISLKLITGKHYPLRDLEKPLFHFCEKRYAQIFDDPESLHHDYDNMLYRKNEAFNYRKGRRQLKGVLEGTTFEGLLIVNSEEGLKKYGMKEIEWDVST